MLLTITATNPRGLDFEYAAKDVAQVKEFVKAILARGGEDLKLNGKPIPAALLATV